MAWAKTSNIVGPQGFPGDPGVPELNHVVGSAAGVTAELTLWTGTQDEYDAIPVKDPLTVYAVI